jgi:hypothetical protein
LYRYRIESWKTDRHSSSQGGIDEKKKEEKKEERKKKEVGTPYRSGLYADES